MRFGSVCSGIEAASVAWGQLGWRAAWLAEIEKFPSAVLAHHYPDVPNLGDMTKLPERIRSGEIEAPDVFCGGTPCQAFSVAGMRRSLDDARGNLSLTFCTIADEIDAIRSVRGDAACIVFWENVPGVLSTKDNAFGCFLAGLAGEELPLLPPGGKWSNAGAVFGPARTVAWRVTDAQYFGVAQRRRRVFVVASARKGFDPCKVLFEFDGVRRDTAPSREAGEGAAGGVGAGAEVGSRHNSHWNGGAHPPLSQGAQTRGGGIGASNQEIFEQGGAGLVQAFGGNNQAGPIDVATARNACASASGRMDFESETFLVVQPAECITGAITHTLKADGFDASEDGTGRGTPIIPVPMMASGAFGANGAGIGLSGDPAFTLDTCGSQAIAFSAKDYGADAGSLTPTLRSMWHYGSHANGGGQVAVAFGISPDCFDRSGEASTGTAGDRPGLGIEEETAYALRTQRAGGVAILTQIRRLTPMECCRLQGFPDDYLSQVTWRGNCPPPDGPMYKALGNSWAVPNVVWIGRRIVAELERGNAA